MYKTAVILPCYNQPDRADAIVRYLRRNVDSKSIDLYVLDNGSDRSPYFATHRVDQNLGTGGGVWYALDLARNVGRYDFYWLLSTSLQFVETRGGDPLASLIVALNSNRAAAAGAGWLGNIQSWAHQFMRSTGQDRETRFINPFGVLWDAAWWDAVDGFDRRLTTGWGSDYELSWKARRDGMKLIVCGSVEMVVTEGATYQTMTEYMEYQARATAEMNTVLSEKYGKDWKAVLLEGVQ